jgi:hypothetical protein
MKTSKSNLNSFRRWITGLVGLLLIFSLAFGIPSGVAFADSSTPTAQPQHNPVPHNNSGLQNQYQREQSLLGKQTDNLNNSANMVTKIQDLITKGQAKGLDTSAVSTALAAFQNQVSTAQSSHSTAAALLSSHAGFDGSGNVTDPTTAAQTVKEAGQALKDTHDVLSQAVRDLHTAVNNWREANKDKLQSGDLQKAYQNEQKWLTTQQGNLTKANDVVSKIQTLISNAQAKNLDTSALSAALATFQSQLATAQASDSTAANLLSAHAGFDGSGNVTDQAAAAQTVKDANQALKTAGDTLKQATQDLKSAVQAWEAANKGKGLGQDLQKTYQNEQTWLATQTTNLGKANDQVAKIQALITQGQGKGQDTAALQSALTTYQAQLVTAGASHSTATNILSTHSGFDGSGNVTDQTSAAQTVKDANQALSDAHKVLVQAVSDLQKAVQAWKTANP